MYVHAHVGGGHEEREGADSQDSQFPNTQQLFGGDSSYVKTLSVLTDACTLHVFCIEIDLGGMCAYVHVPFYTYTNCMLMHIYSKGINMHIGVAGNLKVLITRVVEVPP